MFSDLNRHAIRPSTSIAKLYDHRDSIAEIIRRVFETEVFKGVVEMERSTIAERSSKLFPFSGIYSASKNLIDLENKKIDQQVNTLSLFGKQLVKILINGEVRIGTYLQQKFEEILFIHM